MALRPFAVLFALACSSESTSAPTGSAGTGASTAGFAGVASLAAGGTSSITAAGAPATGGVEIGDAGGVAAAGQPAAAGAAGIASAGAAGAGGTAIALFNGEDLSGFVAFREPASALTAEEAAAIFKVEDGAIHVYGDAPDQSTQARYTLVTAASFTKYELSLEYRWGIKKFAPYTDLAKYPRDAGVLFHLHGDTTRVWPSSIEFQIKDGTTGDIFALYARCTSLAKSGGSSFVPAEAGGTEKLIDGSNGFVQHGRSESFELPEWNQLRLVVDAGAASYFVNGHLVNQVLTVMDQTGKPVTSGRIALQAEHAEVFYRNVLLREPPGMAPTVPPECGASTPVSFERDVEPFLTASCGKGNGSGCHVTDGSSTVGSRCPDGSMKCGFDHAYDWITAGSHNEFCKQAATPIRYTVVMDVLRGAKPPSCSASRIMPPDGPPPTACQLAVLEAWLALPKVVQVHRADDTSPAEAYPMPPFN